MIFEIVGKNPKIDQLHYIQVEERTLETALNRALEQFPSGVHIVNYTIVPPIIICPNCQWNIVSFSTHNNIAKYLCRHCGYYTEKNIMEDSI